MSNKDNYGVIPSTGEAKAGGIDGLETNKVQKKSKRKGKKG